MLADTVLNPVLNPVLNHLPPQSITPAIVTNLSTTADNVLNYNEPVSAVAGTKLSGLIDTTPRSSMAGYGTPAKMRAELPIYTAFHAGA
jgi:hypothetical protein